jgi:signal transduction histidine kinase
VVQGIEQPLWVLELSLLGAALLLVPDGRLPGPRWRFVAVAGIAVASLTFLAVLLVPSGPVTGASSRVPSALSIGAFDNTAGHVIRTVLAVLTEVMVVACVVSLVVRYRRGDQTSRQQLKWVLLGASTIPVFVAALLIVHLASGSSGAGTVLVESAGFDIVLVGIPLTIALAMNRYRLYSVDEVVDSTIAWLAVSVVLLATMTVLVLLIGVVAGTGARRSPIAVALATAAAVLLARPMHRFLQRAINRRFHRRSHDAVRMVATYVERLRAGVASLDGLEEVLRDAVGDAGLVVEVPVGGAGWVRIDGSPVGTRGSQSSFEVHQGDLVVARLVTSPTATDQVTVRDVARAAVLPLENARLRAQVIMQLEEVRASRQRIVAAQYEERRRLERDLHDGAQQRLVAAVMALALARQALTADPAASDLVDQATGEVTTAIKEVRELARGLHPAVLTEEGLVAALESVADRLPAAITVVIPELVAARLSEAQTAAVYFGVCECITNAVKHAAASTVAVRGASARKLVRFDVCDDGVGGAWLRPGGGLAGIADRFEATGGVVVVESAPGKGTVVTMEIACGS